MKILKKIKFQFLGKSKRLSVVTLDTIGFFDVNYPFFVFSKRYAYFNNYYYLCAPTIPNRTGDAFKKI